MRKCSNYEVIFLDSVQEIAWIRIRIQGPSGSGSGFHEYGSETMVGTGTVDFDTFFLNLLFRINLNQSIPSGSAQIGIKNDRPNPQEKMFVKA